MVVSGVGGGGGPVTQHWTFHFSSTGINTFAFPFDPTTVSLAENGKVSVRKLIEEINKNSNSKAAVSSFGWFDSGLQKHIGLIDIPATCYSPNGTFKDSIPLEITATGGTVDNILNNKDNLHAITNMSQPYQVTVREGDIDLSLTGTVLTNP